MKKCLIIFLVLIVLPACTPPTETLATQTTEMWTPTPELTETLELTATIKPSPTPVWVTLGSPFAADCGDGIPRIWSNDSYNGLIPSDYDSKMDEHHGHVDIMIPDGCSGSTQGLVIAPVSGELIKYGNTYHLYVEPKTYLQGIEEAFDFIGISKITLSNIHEIYLNLAHFDNFIEGNVYKGQPIGTLVKEHGHWKISYQVAVVYESNIYIFSPSIFSQDTQMICYPNSPYDCEPEPNDYAPQDIKYEVKKISSY